MNEELQNILHKIHCLFMKYGIKSVTMDDISRELGISKKTLYQYVTDKNDLVQKIVDLEIQERESCFSQMLNPELNAIEEVVEVNKIVNKMLKDYSPVTEYDLRKYYPELHNHIIKIRRERVYNNILNNLRKGKSEGLYRTDIDEVIIAKIQLSRIEAAFDDKVFTTDELLSPKIFRELFVYHIRGIASEKGLKLLEEKLSELDINN